MSTVSASRRATNLFAESRYQLARGYALAVLHIGGMTSTGYGVDTEADVEEFARQYQQAAAADPAQLLEVAAAFGEWRATGNVTLEEG